MKATKNVDKNESIAKEKDESQKNADQLSNIQKKKSKTCK
jgi:hypothetical protein